MPCDSTVTKTKLVDGERLGEAMEGAGYTDVLVGVNAVTGRKDGTMLSYFRDRAGQPFSTYATGAKELVAINRRYAELGVRAWAKRAGYAVTANDGNGKITLTNRRG